MNTIEQWLKEKKRKLHFTLIDPDKQRVKKAVEMAKTCQNYGTDAIMIGGSTINHRITEETTRAIKNLVEIPIIIFPNSVNSIVKNIEISLNKEKSLDLRKHIEKNYIWSVIAKKTIKIYEKILSE